MYSRAHTDESSRSFPRTASRFTRGVLRDAIAVAATLLAVITTAANGEPPRHYPWSADMAPGTVGQGQLLSVERMAGYFQPIQIRVPSSARVSLAMDGTFVQPQKGAVTAGMQVGQVYRFQVSNIPLNEGLEVYPTVEVINRLHPPPGEEAHFPVPVELTLADLELALAGKLVTRVIYLEPPDTALPRSADPERQRYFDVGARNDPLRIADELGRPMAIVRLGGIVPDQHGPTDDFLFGSPPLLLYETGSPDDQDWEPLQSPQPLEAR